MFEVVWQACCLTCVTNVAYLIPLGIKHCINTASFTFLHYLHMTTDISIASKRRNRLLRSVMNALQGYKRKKKNNQLKVAVASPLIAMEDSQLIVSTKLRSNSSPSCARNIDISSNQKALTSRLSIKSLTKAIHDSGVSMSRSTSLASHIEILPNSDVQELDRMVSQHYILRTAFDADYSAPIALSADPESSSKVVVLDIGCGSGTWTMEMATQFPQAHFIGVDKQASFPHDIKPKNCHFKLFDINQSMVKLPFLDQSVDYIFQRDLNWNLSETTWLPLVKEFFRVLKPGGWIELVEPVRLYARLAQTQSTFFVHMHVYHLGHWNTQCLVIWRLFNKQM